MKNNPRGIRVNAETAALLDKLKDRGFNKSAIIRTAVHKYALELFNNQKIGDSNSRPETQVDTAKVDEDEARLKLATSNCPVCLQDRNNEEKWHVIGEYNVCTHCFYDRNKRKDVIQLLKPSLVVEKETVI